MSNPVCTAFANLPPCQSPVAGPVQAFVWRLEFWRSLSAPAPELRDALKDIVNQAGAVLHAALVSHGEDQLAADLVSRGNQLFRSADSYAGAYDVRELDSLEKLYVAVVRAVDGLIAWLEDTDYELRPKLGGALVPPTPAAPPVPEPAAQVAGPSDALPAGPMPTAAAAAAGAGDAASSVRTVMVDRRTETVEYCGVKAHLQFNMGFQILEFLAKRPGLHWECSEVISGVWGDANVENHVIDEHVYQLRKALRKQPQNQQLWADLALRIQRRQRRWHIDLS